MVRQFQFLLRLGSGHTASIDGSNVLFKSDNSPMVRQFQFLRGFPLYFSLLSNEISTNSICLANYQPTQKTNKESTVFWEIFSFKSQFFSVLYGMKYNKINTMLQSCALVILRL